LLLLVGTKDNDRVRPEDIDMNGRGGRHPARRLGDLMHHQRGFGQAKARSAIFFRPGDAEPARFRHGGMKIEWKFARAVSLAPVIIIKTGAERRDILNDGLLFIGQREVHLFLPCYSFLLFSGGRTGARWRQSSVFARARQSKARESRKE